jgi:carbonic anhydrase
MTKLNELIDGYRRFRDTGWSRERDRWAELAEGQSPKVMVIACSDSRVDPAQIFDVRPGEIFVVRNVANLVPPYETGGGHHGVSAALEFAVTQLQVEEVIVLGHGFCGGCAAALTGQFDDAPHGEGHFIADWIELLGDAREKVRSEHGSGGWERPAFRAMELEGVRTSLKNLRTFPFVEERVSNASLALHGAFFSIAEGVLHVLDEDSGEFSPA